MDISFHGRAVIVTAAASGIGAATAEEFALAGAALVLTDINDPAGEDLAARLREDGSDVQYVHADMTRAADAEALVAKAISTLGRLDVLVNCVSDGGGDRRGIQVHEVSEEQWDGTIAGSLKSAFLGMKYAILHMKDHGGGAIVNITSPGGMHLEPASTPACMAANAGAIHLARVAAAQYARYGIRVNSVAPGLTRTSTVDGLLSAEQQVEVVRGRLPVGRLAEPADLARSVVWLASDQAAMITGNSVPGDGGQNPI
ncbi:SDR family NAD(P)-dependent oxidoreductase [Streptomyces sp. NPDC101234]|uniref:SDR family NAD(P)-dependent oxidoreductase n=1 Tax=Streptomyces sp. NPDC101234 TaxID=3366138 RepID=UPI003805A688